jgi:hypothetical protein
MSLQWIQLIRRGSQLWDMPNSLCTGDLPALWAGPKPVNAVTLLKVRARFLLVLLDEQPPNHFLPRVPTSFNSKSCIITGPTGSWVSLSLDQLTFEALPKVAGDRVFHTLHPSNLQAKSHLVVMPGPLMAISGQNLTWVCIIMG